MKNILVSILTLITILTYSQELIQGKVISKNTNAPIPYVNIVKDNNKEGTYSNEAGNFEISLRFNESVIISAIGYKKKRLSFSELKMLNGEVVIEENATELAAVIVESKRTRGKSFTEIWGFHNSEKKTRLSTKTPGFQVATFIENRIKTDGFLETIFFNIVSSGKSRIRIRIYSRDSNFKPDKELTSNDIIINVGIHKGLFRIDLRDQNLIFPKEGLFIGVEFMGNVGKENNLIYENGTEIRTKILLSKNDEQRNTWTNFMGQRFEKEMYSTIYNTMSNAMIGAKVRFYQNEE